MAGCAILLFIIGFFHESSAADVNPAGEQVRNGDASFDRDGRTLTIRQNSRRLIVDWQSFSIGAGNTTRFIQPDANASALNKVVGGARSLIDGRLEANGKVFLLNPAGITVGPSGIINVNSFTASTLDLSDESYLAAESLAFEGDSEAGIEILGQLRMKGGNALLISREISVDGSIEAPHGNVGLAAAREVLIQPGDEGATHIFIKPDAVADAAISFEGTLRGQNIEARTAGNPYAAAINLDGLLEAADGGEVAVVAQTGLTRIEGSLQAPGGSIHVLGDEVEIGGTARLDASSAQAGGEILIGGNQAGRGPQKNSQRTSVEAGAAINADASVEGDGGRVIVWSDGQTDVNGNISVRGGATGGDGGFVETSGLESIDFTVTVDASAAAGQSGLWLIDPANIVIDRAMADAIESSLDKDTDILVTTFTGWPAPESETVTDEASADFIGSTESTAPGNITVDAAITKRVSDQTIEITRIWQTRGDVPIGAETQPLPAGADPVYLLHGEVQNDGTIDVTDSTIVDRADAQAQVDAEPTLYAIDEVPDDLEVVVQVTRDAAPGTNVPTLEFLTAAGDITINAPIRSLNGSLDVVINAGMASGFTRRDENVAINADIHTNGGDLLVRSPHRIDVAAGVTVSTRDLFGGRLILDGDTLYLSDASNDVIRFLDTTSGADRDAILAARDTGLAIEEIAADTIKGEALDTAVTTRPAGDITLMVDKLVGFSNFWLFYRSDIAGVGIGDGARLLAHGDDAHSGSVRVLSVANITGLGEDTGWLGVRNYTNSTVDIGSGVTVRGGAIDIIADAQATADVGTLIDKIIDTLGATTTVTVSPDDHPEASNIADLIFNPTSSPETIEQALADDPQQGSQDSGEIQVPLNLLTNAFVQPATDALRKVPVLGDFLTTSPLAVAIAEASARLTVGAGATIEGSDVVTVRANAVAAAEAGAEFPGLAFSLAYTDANSLVEVNDSAVITSTADDRAEPAEPGNLHKPFLKFSFESPFGTSREFLSDRDSDGALDVSSVATTDNIVTVAAGTLTEEAAKDITSNSGAQANNSGKAKTPGLDAPFDVGLGISITNNNAELVIAPNSELNAKEGTANLVARSNNSVKQSVRGGKVVRPEVKLDENGNAQVKEVPDANDVVSAALAVQYANVATDARIDGTVNADAILFGATSEVINQTNNAVADQGYDETFDPDSNLSKKRTKLRADQQESNPIKQFLMHTVFDAYSTYYSLAQTVDNLQPEEFGLAGAVAISANDYDVDATVGSSASLNATSPSLQVLGTHNSGIIHNSANAGVHEGRENATALAVSVGVYGNDVTTTIEDGAVLRVVHPATPAVGLDDGAGAIRIVAETTVESPFSLELYEAAKVQKDFGKLTSKPASFIKRFVNPVSHGKDTINELIRNGNLLTTGWANSYFVPGDPTPTNSTSTTTQTLNAASDFSAGVGVAGSVNVEVLDNVANVVIGAADISVIGGNATSNNDIEIVADAWAHNIMAAGTIAPTDSGEEEAEGFGDNSFIPGSAPGKGAGGAVNIAVVENSAHIAVRDGATLTAETGDLYANTRSHYESQLVQVAGGSATDISVNGAFGLNLLNQHASSTFADGAVIDVRDINITAVTHLPGNVMLSGGFAFSGAKGVGAGVGVSTVDRSAIAELGVAGEGDQAGAGGSVTAEKVNVVAGAEGFVTTLAVAGGIQTPTAEGFSGNSQTTASTQRQGAGISAAAQAIGDTAGEMTGGVGLSGSASVTLTNSETRAEASVPEGFVTRSLKVIASDNVDVTGLAGGAALSLEGGVAVTGAAAINRVTASTEALLNNVGADRFTGYDVTVDASSIGRIQGIAVGLAASAGEEVPDADPTSPDAGADPSGAIAGSFTYNEINSETLASIDASTLNLSARPAGADADDEIDDDGDAVRVTAADGSQVLAIAGALAINISPGGDGAVGAGVGLNILQGRVSSAITDSTINGADPGVLGVAVAANRIAPIYAFGVAGAGGNTRLAAAASVGINLIDTLADKGTFAHIDDSTIEAIEDVTVQSGSESQILSLAGAIAATTGNNAVGGAVSFSEIGSSAVAGIANSTVTVDGAVSIFSSTHAEADEEEAPLPAPNDPLANPKETARQAAALYVSAPVALIKARDDAAPPEVKPVDSEELFGVRGGIVTLAVAGGGSTGVAAFGSSTINIIDNAVNSTITDSTITTGGDVNVLANNASSIRSAAGSVAVSFGPTSIGGAATYNTLRGNTDAAVTDSDIISSDGDILVGAGRAGEIDTLGAAAAVSSSVGVQGSIAISTFGDRVESSVKGSDLEALGALDVISSESLRSVTAAGGLSGSGAVAVGASLALVLGNNQTLATVDRSTAGGATELDANGRVAVRAVSDEDHETIAMTASVSGSVAVAGSIGIKIINTETAAIVGGDTTVNRQVFRDDGTPAPRTSPVRIESDATLALSGEAGAVGVGISATGVGAGLDLNVVNAQSSAIVSDGADIRGRTEVKVAARNTRDITSLTVAGGGGLVGVAGAVSIVDVGGGSSNTQSRQALGQESYTDEDGNEQMAGDVAGYAQGRIDPAFSNAQVATSSTVPASADTLAWVGDASLEVTGGSDEVIVRADGVHDVDVITGALAVGAVGAGAGVGVVTYNSETRAQTEGAQLRAFTGLPESFDMDGGTIIVEATDTDRSTHTPAWMETDPEETTVPELLDDDEFAVSAFAGSSGIAALGAAVVVVDRDNNTIARITGGETLTPGQVRVEADRNRRTRAYSFGAQVGAATAGATVAVIDEAGLVEALAGGSIGTDSQRASHLIVNANADNTNNASAESAAAGFFGTGSGTVAEIDGTAVNVNSGIDNDAEVWLEQAEVGSSTTGRLDMTASGRHANHASTDSTGAAAGVAVGVVESKVLTDAVTKAGVGDRSVVNAEGWIDIRSQLDAAELAGGTYKSLNEAEARGTSAALLGGVVVINAITEQDLDATVSAGADAVISSGLRADLAADVNGAGFSDASGGAVAAGAGVGKVNAINRDTVSSLVSIGPGATVEAPRLHIDSITLSLPAVRTSAFSGSIGGAVVNQDADVEDGASTAGIVVADGVNLTGEINLFAQNMFSAGSAGDGDALAAGAYANVGSNISAATGATVDVGAATLDAGDADVTIRARNFDQTIMNVEASADGAGAFADMDLDVTITGNATVELADGASVAGQAVTLESMHERPDFSINGISEVLGLVGDADISLDSVLNMDVLVDIHPGARIIGHDLKLIANQNAGTRDFDLDLELDNTSGTFFLSLDGEEVDRIDRVKSQINHNGELLVTSATGSALEIIHFGTTITGSGADFARLEGGVLVVENLSPAGGAGSVLMDAGDVGAVGGAGTIVRADNFISDLTITSLGGGVRLGDIDMLADDSGLDPTVTIVSLPSLTTSFDIVPLDEAPVPTVTVEADLLIEIAGTVDVGPGSLFLTVGESLGGFQARIEQSAGSIRTGQLVVEAPEGSVGTADKPLKVTFVDSPARDPFVSGFANGDLNPGEFHLQATLEGHDDSAEVGTLFIGDIYARNVVDLAFGAAVTSSGTAADGRIAVNGIVSSLGAISIDAADASTFLDINGEIRQGFDADVNAVYVDILGENSVDTNWPGLFTRFGFDEGIDGWIATIGNIVNADAPGITIDAPNLAGTGLIFGNGAGLDVELTNKWSELKAFHTYNISMLGGDIGITINGDDAATSFDFGDIRIERLSSDEANSVRFTDGFSEQMVVVGDITTTGNMFFNLPNAFTIQTSASEWSEGALPVISANSLQIQVEGGSIGRPDNPLQVNLGEGGLFAQATGDIYLNDVGDSDLIVRTLEASTGGTFGELRVEAQGGSIIGVPIALGGRVSGRNATLTAAGDILLGDLDIDVAHSVTLSGRNIEWRENGEIVIGGLEATGDVIMTSAGGAIEGSGTGLIIGGDATFAAGGGRVMLNHAANDFGGVVSISALSATEVRLRDTGDLLLGDIEAGIATGGPGGCCNERLFLTSGTGSIRSVPGAIVQSGVPLVIDAALDIALGNAGNNLNDQWINFRGANVTLATLGNIELYAADAEGLAPNSASGNLFLDASGDIFQNSYVTVGGTTTLDAGGAITLVGVGSDNVFTGSVSARAGQGIDLRSGGHLDLASLESHGPVELRSLGGDITDSGEVNVFAETLLLAAGDIILDTPTNNLGVVGVASVDPVITLGNVTLLDRDSLSLYPVKTSGLLRVEAQHVTLLDQPDAPHVLASTLGSPGFDVGSLVLVSPHADIERDDLFTVAGDASIEAFDISLTHASIGGELSLTGRFGRIENDGAGAGDVTLGTISLVDLLVSAPFGSIVDTGTVLVGRQATLAAPAGDVILDSAANDFGTVYVPNAGTVVLNDVDDIRLKLGTATQTPGADPVPSETINSVTVTAGSIAPGSRSTANFNDFFSTFGDIDEGGVFVSGDLSLTATTGDITDGGAGYQVGGNAVFDAAGSIILYSPYSDITGSTLLLTDVAGTFDLIAGRDIFIDRQASTFVNADFSFDSALTFDPTVVETIDAGRNVTILASEIALDTLTAGGNLTLNTNFTTLNTSGIDGTISASGAVTVGGTTRIDTLGNVTFANAANDFGGAISIVDHTGAAFRKINGAGFEEPIAPVTGVSLVDQSGIVLGKLSLPNAALTVNAAGIVVTGPVTAGDTLTLSGTDITVDGLLQTDGEAELIASAGGIAGTGRMVVGGITILNGAGDILLDSVGQDFQGKVTATGANVRLADDDAITFGKLTATGHLTVSAGAISVPVEVNAADNVISAGGDALFEATTGDVTIERPLTLTGALTANAAGAFLAANADNSIGGAVGGSAGTFSVTNDVDIVIGTLSADSLVLSSLTGSIDDDAANLSVSNQAEFSTPNALVLDNPANRINGIVSASAESIEITSDSDITTGTLTASTLGVTLTAASIDISDDISVAGDVDLTATAGDILGNFNTVSGTQLVIQSAGEIHAVRTDFTGTITTNAGGSAFFSHSSGTFGQLSVGGDLTILAGSELVIDGALDVGGYAQLEADVITADNPANSVAGSVALDMNGRVDYVEAGDVLLGVIDGTTTASEVHVTSISGSISTDDSGASHTFGGGIYLNAAGDVNFVSRGLDWVKDFKQVTGNNITLDTRDVFENAFTGSVFIVMDDITLGDIQADGDLFVRGYTITTGVDAVTANGSVTLLAEDTGFSGEGIFDVGAGGISSQTGDILIWGETEFHNNSGNADPLSTPNGRWLVYSARPDVNTADLEMSQAFIRYNRVLGPDAALPSDLPAGNGLIFSVQPVLGGPSVTPVAQSIVYGESIDGVASAELLASLAGSLDGTVTVDGVVVDPADFGIDTSSFTATADDIRLGINESTISRSSGGYIEAGTWTDAISASVVEDPAAPVGGLAIGGTADLTVTPRPVTAGTIVVSDVVYDGFAEFDVRDLDIEWGAPAGMMTGDDLRIDTAETFALVFDDPNAELNKPAQILDLYLFGYDVDNYTLADDTGTATVNLLPRELFVTLNPVSKLYDGTTAIELTADDLRFDNLAFGDSATIASAAFLGQFDDPAVGTGKTLTVNIDQSDISSTSANFFTNYTFINNVTGSSGSIDPAPLTVSAADESVTYDGTAFSGGTPVFDGLVNGETAAVLDGTAIFGGDAQGAIDAGSYAIAVSGLSAANYDITFVDGALTIDPAPLTVSGADVTTVYDGTAFSGNDGVEYSGFITGEGPHLLSGALTWDGDSQGAIDAGTYALTPGGLTAQNYAITFVDGTLTISPRLLGVSLAPQSKRYDGTTDALIDGSDLTLVGFVDGQHAQLSDTTGSWNSKDVTAATTVTAVLDETLFADGSGGFLASNYALPATVSNTNSQITPAPLTVIAADAGKTYDGLAFSGGNGASYEGLVNGETAAVLSGSLNWGGEAQGAVDAGSYALGVSGLTSSNYDITFVDATLAVDPALLTVTANDATRVFDGVKWTGGNGVSYAGFVNGEDATVLTGSVAFEGTSQGARNAGTYTLSPGVLSADNYMVSFVDGTLTIDPKLLGVTLLSQSKRYDGTTDMELSISDFQLTGLAPGDLAILGGDLTGSYNDPNVAHAHTVTVSLASAALVDGSSGFLASNYLLPASTSNDTSVIDPAPLTVTAVDAQKTYGDTLTLDGTTFGASGLVGSETIGAVVLASAGTSAEAVVLPGGYEITASGAAGGTFDPANYAITYENGILTVNPRPIVVTAGGGTSTYGESPVGPGLTVDNLASFDMIDVIASLSNSFGIDAVTAAGDHAMFVTGAFDDPNYELVERVDGNWTVLPKALTITALDQTKVFGDELVLIGSEFAIAGLVNGEVVDTVTLISDGLAADAGVVAGGYSLDASAPVGSAGFDALNYDIDYVAGVLTVDPRSVTVTATGGSSTYGDSPANPGIAADNLASFDDVSVLAGLANDFAVDNTSAAGDYVLQVAGTLTNGNYVIDQRIAGTWTVDPAQLIISARGQAKTYGDTFVFAGTEFSATGLVNGETVGSADLASTGVAATADAGTYLITPSAATGGTFDPANYDISYGQGVFTVDPRGIVVTVNGGSSVYGETNVNPGFSIDNLASFDDQDVITGISNSFGITAGTHAGTYILTVDGNITNGNYVVGEIIEGSWTVAPRPLEVVADDIGKTYGDTYMFNGNEFSAEGLVNGDIIDSVALSSIGAEAAAGVLDGGYVITVGGATGTGFTPANYDITYTGSTLTVTPRPVSVAGASGSSIYGDSPANPGLVADNLAPMDTVAVLTGLSSDFTVTATSDAGAYAVEVEGELANGNYVITDRSAGTWTVVPASLNIIALDQRKTYGERLVLSGDEFIAEGLVNGETVARASIESTGAEPDAAVVDGGYVVTISDARGGTFSEDNYDISYVDGTLTVDPREITVTALGGSSTYGESPSSAGLAADNLATFDDVDDLVGLENDFGIEATTDAGEYTLAVVGMLENANYRVVARVDGSWTVAPAPLTIAALDQVKPFGSEFVFAGEEFESDGLVNGETIDTVTLSSDGALSDAPVDDYLIEAGSPVGSGFEAANYDIDFEAGVLTVEASRSREIEQTVSTPPMGGGAGGSGEGDAGPGDTPGSVPFVAGELPSADNPGGFDPADVTSDGWFDSEWMQDEENED